MIIFNYNVAVDSFTEFPVSLPVSPLYSICAIWKDQLFVLNGQIGNNYSDFVYKYNFGLYSIDLHHINNNDTNNSKWLYKSKNQLPSIESNGRNLYDLGLYTQWQSYTQIDDLLYILAPEPAYYTYQSVAKSMLIYSLSSQEWIDSSTYSHSPIISNLAVCATNNDTHIFGIGGYIINDWQNTQGFSQIYDILHDIWSITSSMEYHIYSTGCSYSHFTNYIYTFGGTFASNEGNWDLLHNLNTDMIGKYNVYNNSWKWSKKRLPKKMANLYCYEMSLKRDKNIYCMHGVDTYHDANNPYDYIMKFDILTEIIIIIDRYDLPIPSELNIKYPVYGYMSAIYKDYAENYALLYVIGGAVNQNENHHYYFDNVQYKLFTDPITDVPTTTKPTLHPTVSPTTSKPTTSKPTTAEPTTSKPTFSPTTMKPTTAKPTTAKPTTAKPTTTKPTTMKPTTAKPTISPTLNGTVLPSINPSINIQTTELPISKQNYLNTPMGKITLIMIGLCVILVVIGLIIYYKSEHDELETHQTVKKNDPYVYLHDDIDAFKL